jgi:hypothetical protein
MLDALRADWRRLKNGESGRRFSEVHRARRAREKHSWTRVAWLVLAGVLIALGPLAGLIPGPGGIFVLLLGLALLARELRAVARALDWSEPRLRRAWQRVRHGWKRSTTIARVGFCLVLLAALGGGGWLWFALMNP